MLGPFKLPVEAPDELELPDEAESTLPFPPTIRVSLGTYEGTVASCNRCLHNIRLKYKSSHLMTVPAAFYGKFIFICHLWPY